MVLTETVLFVRKIFAVVHVVALERLLDASRTIFTLKPFRLETLLWPKWPENNSLRYFVYTTVNEDI